MIAFHPLWFIRQLTVGCSRVSLKTIRCSCFKLHFLGNTVTAVLLDYQVDFDCLEQNHLLKELTSFGIHTVNKSISRYFNEGSHLVKTVVNKKTVNVCALYGLNLYIQFSIFYEQ